MLTVNAASGFGSGGGVSRGTPPNSPTRHYRADLGITEATGVSDWVDQISGSASLANVTGAQQPILTAAAASNGGPNELDYLTFDGSDDDLSGSGVTLTNSSKHVFLVLRQVVWAANQIFFSSLTASGDFKQHSSSSPNVAIGADAATVGPNTDLTMNTWMLADILHDDTANSHIIINDGAATTGDPGFATFSAGIIVGSSTGPANAEFDLAELIMYDGEQSGSNLTDIRTYINDQYNLF